MKILLICAGGASTSILMKKMKKYTEEKSLPLEDIVARGVGDYESVFASYDVLLLAPQISYKKAEIQRITGKPIDTIAPYDYAIGNAEHIYGQAQQLMDS